MAVETPCQTPGAVFHTQITSGRITVTVDPGLDVDEAAARQIEADLHNVFELVLSRWWPVGTAPLRQTPPVGTSIASSHVAIIWDGDVNAVHPMTPTTEERG